MSNNKGTIGNILKGFTIGFVSGMITLHFLCNSKCKKKVKHNAQIASDNFCSMFKMK